jgi:hypothetical protein
MTNVFYKKYRIRLYDFGGNWDADIYLDDKMIHQILTKLDYTKEDVLNMSKKWIDHHEKSMHHVKRFLK